MSSPVRAVGTGTVPRVLVFSRAMGGDLFDVSLIHTNLLSQELGIVEKGLGISWFSRVFILFS